MIELQCPCGFKSRHEPSQSGKLVRCRRCRARQRVPRELDPAELLQALEEQKVERTHHYVFAHRIVPEVAFSDPQHVMRLLRSDKGPRFLEELWEEVGQACPRHLPGEGLRLTTEELEGVEEQIALIRLPEPRIPPEAHFLAIVPWTERRLLGLVKKRVLRCFTLELGIRLTGGLRTVLCEWTRGGQGELLHRNYGDGPEATPGAFLGRLAEVLGRG